MHNDHNIFVRGIRKKRKIELVFLSIHDNLWLAKLCAPIDFYPARRTKDHCELYYFWDFCDDSDSDSNLFALSPEQIINIKLTNEKFKPAEFLHWDKKWYISRQWDHLGKNNSLLHGLFNFLFRFTVRDPRHAANRRKPLPPQSSGPATAQQKPVSLFPEKLRCHQ